MCEALNFPAEWPDGLLAHGSVEVDGKLRVYDVWQSRAQFDQFVADSNANAVGAIRAPETLVNYGNTLIGTKRVPWPGPPARAFPDE